MVKSFIFVFILSAVTFFRSSAQTITITNPDLIPIILVKQTQPLSEIASSPPDFNKPRVEREDESLEHQSLFSTVNPNALPHGADPAWQKDYNLLQRRANAPGVNVLSAWNGLKTNIDPSDNTLAVGPNHVVQMANNDISTYMRVWNKSGNVLAGSILIKDLNGIEDYGDPNIIWDSEADRWVMVLLSDIDKNFIVGISDNGDPTSTWKFYNFQPENGYPDYPKIAVWGNSYLISSNSSVNNKPSPTVFALDRVRLLSGQSIGTVQVFKMIAFPTINFQTPTPVTFTGSNAAPSGRKGVAVRVYDDGWGGGVDRLELYEMDINWVTPANSTITGPLNLPTIPYSSDNCGFDSYTCVPQPGSSILLDPLAQTIMDKIQYRNFGDHEAFVCSHVCNADGNGLIGIRWYELRKQGGNPWSIYQQGTYAMPGDHRWMSSMSMNDQGTIAMGYNISSISTYPSIGLTGRLSCDSLNLMTIPENIAKAGSAANSSDRYGDYNGMVTDPIDGSFWFTGNYNPAAAWSTSVIHFTIDACDIAVNGIFSYQNALKIISNLNHDVEAVFTASKSGELDLQLFDAVGKSIYRSQVKVSLGSNHYKIAKDLSTGVYVLKASDGINKYQQKVFVQ